MEKHCVSETFVHLLLKQASDHVTRSFQIIYVIIQDLA